MLSFGQSQPVRIFSKGDGSQQDIWGVEVREKVDIWNKSYAFLIECKKNTVYFAASWYLLLKLVNTDLVAYLHLGKMLESTFV